MTDLPAVAADVAALTFEKALAELETIVARLERGDVALEESIAAYERGEALKAHCTRLLSAAEARVEKIRLSAEGRPVGVEPLDVEGR
ncbi:exodeoxyribonuclease VII small subunit [Siculibacillus lacustris]|uniref:Exodeoxyribonuclease 7 small subunit n=1 Tax=Siculibacillus lacustris TaxID=1549641 RepID=A0A4Q9VHK6_9HYPH|nr:exodeoxyribonuclease VII small subunit [Siculibacillus lacustris]TBW34501.1 exodeoxyribonuclease VII small subunit [Siculibacillus lacustris]